MNMMPWMMDTTMVPEVVPSLMAQPALNAPHLSISWQLVWCYERCHKAENQEQRQVIKKYARTAGASLVCLKKARQFGAWIDRTKRPPFVLVTDWREAQPCLRAVTQHTGTNIPTHMVVLCEGRRQYMRAMDWAKVLRPDVGHVHICEKSAIPAWLLDGVIQRCFTPVPSAIEGNGDNSSNASPEDDDCSDAEDASGTASRTDSLQSNKGAANGLSVKSAKELHNVMQIDSTSRVAKLAVPWQQSTATMQAPPGLGNMMGAPMSSDMSIMDQWQMVGLQEMAQVDSHPTASQKDPWAMPFAGEGKYVVLTHLSL